jgi:hypothetical protein
VVGRVPTQSKWSLARSVAGHRQGGQASMADFRHGQKRIGRGSGDALKDALVRAVACQDVVVHAGMRNAPMKVANGARGRCGPRGERRSGFKHCAAERGQAEGTGRAVACRGDV